MFTEGFELAGETARHVKSGCIGNVRFSDSMSLRICFLYRALKKEEVLGKVWRG